MSIIMQRYSRSSLRLSFLLSHAAGFTDAIGFIASGGYFVSFMSGNSTRFGVGISAASSNAVFAGGLILMFLMGVIAGSTIGRKFGPRRQQVIIGIIGAILFMGTIALVCGYQIIGLLITASAMGMENTIFEADGEVTIGLTYMTGTLVKCGQKMSLALSCGPLWAWLPYFQI